MSTILKVAGGCAGVGTVGTIGALCSTGSSEENSEDTTQFDISQQIKTFESNGGTLKSLSKDKLTDLTTGTSILNSKTALITIKKVTKINNSDLEKLLSALEVFTKTWASDEQKEQAIKDTKETFDKVLKILKEMQAKSNK